MGPRSSLSFTELKKRLRMLGFELRRQKGSHIRYVHSDGRKTTLPDHGSKDVPKGLFTKIVRHDLGMDVDEFLEVTDE